MHYTGKGQVAYLLKSSKPEKTQRKAAKEIATNLQIFKRENHEEEKKEETFTIQRRMQSEEDGMNVDIRPDKSQSTQNQNIGGREAFEERRGSAKEFHSSIRFRD